MHSRLNRTEVEMAHTTMMSNMAAGFKLLLRISLLVLCVARDAEAQTHTPEEVLANLRAFDSLYEDNFSAEGTGTLVPFLVNAGAEVPTKWRITAVDGHWVVEETMTEYLPSPDVVKRRLEQEAGKTRPRQVIIGLPRRRVTFFGPDIAAKSESGSMCSLEADGSTRVIPESTWHDVSLYRPDSVVPVLPLRQVRWSLGRGHSQHIETITSVVEQDDGSLRCEGTYAFRHSSGTYRLVIDPAAGYMVRSADYFSEELKEPAYHVITMGTKWSKGICVPESAAWSDVFQRRKGHTQVTFGCRTFKPEPDMELVASAERTIFGPYDTQTSVRDNRMTPMASYFLKAGESFSSLTHFDFDALAVVERAVNTDKGGGAAQSEYERTASDRTTDEDLRSEPNSGDERERRETVIGHLLIPRRVAAALLSLCLVAGAVYLWLSRRGKGKARRVS